MHSSLKYLFGIIYLIFSCTSGTTAQEALFSNKDTITFIHVTDPHVCNLTGYHPFFIQKRQHYGNNFAALSNFFNTIPGKYRSDFVVITGDNIDYYEAQSAKGGVIDEQIEQYARLIDSVKIPVFLTLGNHDIASYYVGPDLSYTNDQLNATRARAAWMRNISSFNDGTYYSHILKIDTTIFRFIFLDNAYYGTKEIRDETLPFLIDPAQLLWFDAQLRSSPTDVEIIFMHMPLIHKEGKDQAISIEPLSTYASKGKFFNLFSVLGRNPSTRLFFVGHEHDNIINNFSLPNGNRLIQVMTGCFGADPENWRVIKLTKNNITIYYPGSSSAEYVIPIGSTLYPFKQKVN